MCTSLSFVILHTFDGGHDLDHFSPFATFPRGQSIRECKVDFEARAISVFTHATSISMPCVCLFLDPNM